MKQRILRDTSQYKRIELPKAGPEVMTPPTPRASKVLLGHHGRARHTPSDNRQASCVGNYEGSLDSWYHR
jgi:hypothetical protein